MFDANQMIWNRKKDGNLQDNPENDDSDDDHVGNMDLTKDQGNFNSQNKLYMDPQDHPLSLIKETEASKQQLDPVPITHPPNPMAQPMVPLMQPGQMGPPGQPDQQQ